MLCLHGLTFDDEMEVVQPSEASFSFYQMARRHNFIVINVRTYLTKGKRYTLLN
jgi:hypothetical protein